MDDIHRAARTSILKAHVALNDAILQLTYDETRIDPPLAAWIERTDETLTKIIRQIEEH